MSVKKFVDLLTSRNKYIAALNLIDYQKFPNKISTDQFIELVDLRKISRMFLLL